MTKVYQDKFILCECRFHVESVAFYFDMSTWLCMRCPKGCKCDTWGCYECEKYTMRFIDFAYERWPITYVRCPCYQNSYEINGSCTKCFNNSYYNGQTCVDCFACKECDAYGCLSCFDDMRLVNSTCVCIN